MKEPFLEEYDDLTLAKLACGCYVQLLNEGLTPESHDLVVLLFEEISRRETQRAMAPVQEKLEDALFEHPLAPWGDSL